MSAAVSTERHGTGSGSVRGTANGPAWFEGPLTSTMVSRWQSQYAEHGGPAQLHPELWRDFVGGRRWTIMIAGPQPQPVAVWCRRRVPWWGPPGLRRWSRFNGWQLLGDQFLGHQTVERLQQLVQWADDRLVGREGLFVEVCRIDSPLWQALRRHSRRAGRLLVHTRPQPHWRLRFPPHPEHYWQRFSSKSRYNLRREIRRLPHELVVCRRPDQVEHFCDQAAIVSRASWQAQRLHASSFDSTAQRQRILQLARCGLLRSYALLQDGQPLAFALGWQVHGIYYYEQIGFVPAVADRSPGKVLLARMLEDMTGEDTPTCIDFGFGDGHQKQLFGTDHDHSAAVLLLPRSLRNVTWSGLLRCEWGAKHAARQWLNNSNPGRTLRRWHRLRTDI